MSTDVKKSRDRLVQQIAKAATGNNAAIPSSKWRTFKGTRMQDVIAKRQQFPTGKPNHYSQERRYVPITKKSDEGKIHGKPKGRSFKALKMEGDPPSADEMADEDFYDSLNFSDHFILEENPPNGDLDFEDHFTLAD